MTALMNYFRESYNELKNHVTWPSWAELYQTSIVVIVASIMVGLLIWLMDTVWAFIFNFLY